jgi:hypothetical protein
MSKMAKLKIEALSDDKPVKVTLELPASLYRDLAAYAEAVGNESGKPINEPAKLIIPMLTRFMATDRAFAKSRRLSQALARKG